MRRMAKRNPVAVRQRLAPGATVSVPITAAFPFTPITIPNLVGWYDAADTSTITSTSGAVSQWNDKSGLGYALTQATASLQPTTGSTTRNGLNVITFDGGDELRTGYVWDAFRFGLQTTAIAVVKSDRTSSVSEGIVGAEIGNWDFSTGWLLERRTTLLAWTVGRGQVGTSSANDYNSRRFSNSSTSWMIYAADVSARNNSVNAFVNGAAQTFTQFDGSMATTNYLSAANASHRVFVGGRGVYNSFRFLGAIAEILIYSRQLTLNEYQAVNKYLNDKWAIY